MAERLNFDDEISKNKLKSIVLIIVIFAVFLVLGYFFSQFYAPEIFFFIMIIWIIISMSYLIFSYYNSAKIALYSVGAQPAKREQNRQYYNIVEGLTLASGLPMPQLYIMQNEQINAFASGRDPNHAVICVTNGALQKLNREELEGVLAHELSHVANYDVRFMTLTAVMVGLISIASELFLRSLWFRGGDRENNNAVLMVIGIVLAILAPILTTLIQLAISRKREYGADASGVKFVRSPTGLIGALKKIKGDKPMKVPKAVAPLFLSDPLMKFGNLLSTHPDIDSRIKILERM